MVKYYDELIANEVKKVDKALSHDLFKSQKPVDIWNGINFITGRK